MEKDSVEARNDHWKNLFPDACLEGIFGRIQGILRFHNHASTEVMKAYGIKNCEADVLGALLFVGSPYRLQPKDITKYVYRSAGAITNVLDNLEAKGLIVRTINCENRRSIVVELTPKGLEMAKATFTALVDKENEMLSMLTSEDKSTLNSLLKKLHLSLEKKNKA